MADSGSSASAPSIQSAADVKSIVESELGEVVGKCALLPRSGRIEFLGLTLIGKSDVLAEIDPRQDIPEPPQPKEGEEMPSMSSEESAELNAALAGSYEEAAVLHQATPFSALHGLLRFVGERLCPKAAPIPSDAYKTLYTLCNQVPYIVQLDAFMFYPGPGYHFSRPRLFEARRQCWELIRHMHEQGKCKRVVLMSGPPAVGKSTWLQQVASQEPGADTTVFFDDVLNTTWRRKPWLDGFRELGISCELEIVAITRDFDRAVYSNEARGAKGVQVVPLKSMESFHGQTELPSLSEGFYRVRVFRNEHDDKTGEGGYVLESEDVDWSKYAVQNVAVPGVQCALKLN